MLHSKKNKQKIEKVTVLTGYTKIKYPPFNVNKYFRNL